MGDILAIKTFAETMTPGGFGVWTLVLMVGAFLLREYRETRKLSAEDRLARREGYAKQVADLHDENRSLRGDLTLIRHEYDEYRKLCQEENEELRRMVINLENEISALKRRIGVDGIKRVLPS